MKIRVLAAVLLLLVVCGPAPGEPVVLRLWGAGFARIPRKDEPDQGSRAQRAIIEAFEHKHPEIRLEIATGLEIQGPANESGMLMAIASGLAPDVVYVNFRTLENFVNQGFVYPLDEFMKEDPEAFRRIHPGIRNVITINGHVYSYPFQQYVMALYYRKDLFRDAGLDPRRPPKDWEEFYQYAQKLTKPEIGQWGFAFDTGPQATSWWWVNFLWQAGGEVVKQLPDGQWVAAFNTKAGAQALQYYARLVAAPWRMPNGRMQRGVAVRAPQIYPDYADRGRLGMWFNYQSPTMANQSAQNVSPALIGIAPMPKGPTGITGNEVNASMYGICSLQKDPKVRRAAWEFIRFMGSEEADAVRTRAFVENGLAMYVNPRSLRKYGYEDLVSEMSDEWVQTMDKLFLTGKPEPYGKNCQMIYSELDQPLMEIGLYPNRDPMDVLNRAAARINSKLLGYVPEPVMRRRRQIALGAVTGGFIIVLGLVFWMLKRLSTGVAGDPGSRPAGTGTRRYHLVPWLFMAPAVVSIALWAYYPLARGLLMAFQDYRVARPPQWVGLDNFIDAATQPTFWTGMANSFEYVGLSLGIGFLLPVILALLLSEVPRGRMFFRTVYYLPAVTSGLVILFLWKQFYDPSESGLLNQLFTSAAMGCNALAGLVHIPLHYATPVKIDWLGDPAVAMLAVVIPGVWAGAGPGSIIYLAALKTISEELYEAADLDGASILTKVRVITIPTLKPLIIINFVGALIGSFKAMENIFVMTGGGPLYRTHTVGLEVWYNAFMYLKFGYATAAAWIMGAILVGFTLYQLRILRDLKFSAGG